jgi:hypothetical protein
MECGDSSPLFRKRRQVGALQNIIRPLHGLQTKSQPNPTDKSVGYFHSSSARTGLQLLLLVGRSIMGRFEGKEPTIAAASITHFIQLSFPKI